MNLANSKDVRQNRLELVITRVLDAPPMLVYKVWTEPEHMARWMGPKGFTAPSVKMDVREGGRYRALIRSAEGKDYWFQGVYREVVENERLVFTFVWEEEGSQENLVTITFAEENGKTRMAYVDGFIVAVPKKNMAQYRKMARRAGEVWREHARR